MAHTKVGRTAPSATAKRSKGNISKEWAKKETRCIGWEDISYVLESDNFDCSSELRHKHD